MSSYPPYRLYRVGRGPHTFESLGPVRLRRPDLGSASTLPSEYRFYSSGGLAISMARAGGGSPPGHSPLW